MTRSLLSTAVLASMALGYSMKQASFSTGQTFSLQNNAGPFMKIFPTLGTYFQGDGNLVTYDGEPNAENVIWASNTANHDCDTQTCRLNWQGDGNLVITVDGATVWSSGTAGRGQLLEFTSTGNIMEITDGGEQLYWRSVASPYQADPGAGEGGSCDGVNCISCTDCIVESE